MRSTSVSALVPVLAALAGCLGPLVSDDVVGASLILPPGSTVPSIDTDPVLAAQIAANDAVGDFVPRISAFVHGKRVFYLDFGPAPPVAIPFLTLATKDEAGNLVAIEDVPSILDAVPGDPGYSPFWLEVLVPVTEKWKGEVFTSFDAVLQGQEEGLLGEPVPQAKYYNCPVVASTVRVDKGPGEEPRAPSPCYYRGFVTHYFHFGSEDLAGADDPAVPVEDVYLLRREGGEPLSEPMRGVDMTGDGDTFDTNNVFEVGLDDEDYTPLWRVVDVVVPADYASIDTSKDETVAAFTSVDDMFQDEVPRSGKVVAVSPREMLVNCPIVKEKKPEGSP